MSDENEWEIMHFNVGGTMIDVGRETLKFYPKLEQLALENSSAKGVVEFYFDRDPKGFKAIVDYLHIGTRVVYDECPTPADAEFLENEAYFYGVKDLAEKCGALYEFKLHSEVSWRPDVVDAYCPLFAKCIVDPSLLIPFTFERNSHIIARCIACEERHEPKASNVFVFSLQEWSALKHHMLHMVGCVERLVGQSCLLIRWNNGVTTHLPKTAVRVVIDD